jgi:pimeloyl-ACP methyl ester carboxylesterase
VPDAVVLWKNSCMTTFALVHGAWHGSWCWERLSPLLESAGHEVVVMDLACEDADADFGTYADIVCSAIEQCGEDVVLVGHSMGGHTVPLVATRRPIRHLVFLCGLVPEAGKSWADQFRDNPDIMGPDWNKALSDFDDQCRTAWVEPQLMRTLLYADCDEAVAAQAAARLRPQVYLGEVPFALAEFPSVSCTSVICHDDQMVNPEWSKRIARDIDASIVELPGSHSPFLSRPSVVAEVLLGIEASA